MPDPGASEPLKLVADPGGLLVFFERDGEIELLLESLDRPDRSFFLDLAAKSKQEAEFEQLGLLLGLAVLAEERADSLDSPVNVGQGRCVVVVSQNLRRLCARVHHGHVRPEPIELELVALSVRMQDNECEESEFSIGFAEVHVVPLEVDRR